jgi:RimJ/RimL family protein N-acetyltransferase
LNPGVFGQVKVRGRDGAARGTAIRIGRRATSPFRDSAIIAKIDPRQIIYIDHPLPLPEPAPPMSSPAPKPSAPEVRQLGPESAAAYRDLRLRGLKEHPDAFTSSYEEDREKPLAAAERRLASDSDDRVWGAWVDGVLAGVAGLAREHRAKNRHKAVVFGMYVAPEHGRRGIGATLLRHVIDEARRQPGLQQLVLTVTQTNAGARTLYERTGFRSFGVEPRAIRVGDAYFDKNHMILFLAQP